MKIFLYFIKKYAIWIALGLIMIFLLSLSILRPLIHKTTTEIKPIWLSSWLVSPTCGPPCWENITPGDSNFSEAEAIIRRRSDVDRIYLGSGRLGEKQKVLQWYFVDSSDLGEIYSDADGKIVSTILLETGEYMTIQDVISQFGSPDQLTLAACGTSYGPMCFPRLLYPKISLAFGFSTALIDENYNDMIYSIKVLPEDKVTMFVFSPPGIGGYAQSTKSFAEDDMNRIWDWKGYGEYSSLNFKSTK